MTPEQIIAVKQEIETFSQKSIQFATSEPTLSAHYNRLYRASQTLLDRANKLAQTEERKKHAAARKVALEARKKQKASASATPNSR